MGALMLTMDITHPDVLDFIKIKGGKDKTKVQYANISVKITDDFMNSVINDDRWKMRFETICGEIIEREENARVIWDLIVSSNHTGAEPGLLFFDRILENDPASIFDETRPISTNPCGEEPLEKGGACNLSSINLNNFIIDSFSDNPIFDLDKLENIVKLGIRFLDNINIMNVDRQPLEENKIALKLGNRIGLGITGLADAMIRMNVRYGSKESIDLLETIMKTIKKASIESSIDLAIERGACGVIEKYKNSDILKKWINHDYWNILDCNYMKKLHKYGIRNIGLNTVAPNGSISIILRTSSGLEPIFNLSYTRRVKEAGKEREYLVYHPLVEEYDNKFGKDAHLNNDNFIVASNINWKERVNVQSIIQKHTSQSISSTINLPSDIKQETISEIYIEAWKRGLKGVTVYRDGSRDGILKDIKKKYDILETVKFPEEQRAIMKVIKSESKKWYVTYSLDEETKLPNSLFVNTNSSETNILTEDVIIHLEDLAKKHIKDEFLEKLKKKHHNQANVVKIARTLSLLLRHRVPMMEIIKTINIIQPPIFSFVFQIKKLLSSFVEGEYTGDKCDECGSQLQFESGCEICMNCGYTKCG